jgi:hypothetical protein
VRVRASVRVWARVRGEGSSSLSGYGCYASGSGFGYGHSYGYIAVMVTVRSSLFFPSFPDPGLCKSLGIILLTIFLTAFQIGWSILVLFVLLATTVFGLCCKVDGIIDA